MKKIWNVLAKDLWIVLLDIVAVNLSYYLALIIRFFVNGTFRETVSYLIGYWAGFAPVYTVFSIIVFIAWKLYGGMWRYAGINDMNRIIGANACTTVIMIAGTILMNPKRMPISYYVIGAILQFILIVVIRFSYRLLLVEKTRLGQKNSRIPALIIGSGDLGRKVIKHIEDGGAFQPVAILSSGLAGRSMDGVPIFALSDLEKVLSEKKIGAIFIADKELPEADRARVESAAAGLELQDFTGALSNMTGAVPVTGLLETVSTPFTLVIDGTETKYDNGSAALSNLRTKYLVTKISGDIKIELKSDDGMAYLRQHAAETGEELSFF